MQTVETTTSSPNSTNAVLADVLSHTFNEGVMWEDNPFKIEINHECSEYGGSDCKHCHSHNGKIHTRSDGTTYTEKVWICPAVVVVNNEGGFNSTGLCLDCLLEAVRSKNIR